MALFGLVVNSSQDTAKAAELLPRLEPQSITFRKMSDDFWLLKSTHHTTQEISDLLTDLAPDATPLLHMVMRIDSFWGWNDKDYWEWIDAE